jgi:putative ATP-binding cassette transporter
MHKSLHEQLNERRLGETPVAIPSPEEDDSIDRGSRDNRSDVWRDARRLLATLRGAPQRRQLTWLAVGLVGVLIGNMAGQVRLNQWHGDFFDAIEHKGLAAFGQQLVVFCAIIAVLLALVVAQTWLYEMLKVRLREWLTHRLFDAWLAPGRAYRLGMTSEFGINPDQRMQEDTRQLTELSAELGVGLLQSAMQLVSFTGVLWVLSGQIVVTIAGHAIAIPGYMVWCAIGYAAVGSFLTWRVGVPLISLNAERYECEGDLRFALVRVSESAESIALYSGEEDERRLLNATLATVITALRRLSGSLARLTWITSGYGWLAIVVPIVVAAPRYFGDSLTLGGLMMVVGAFNQVQAALRYFVDRFPRIADWRAALGRVAAFHAAVCHVNELEAHQEHIEFATHPAGALALEELSILLADGSVLIQEATAEIQPGERVLIVGESGAGKSTLFRAIAGIWPWGRGRILLPGTAMMFMPQRPYLPLGPLRAAVTYPTAPDSFTTEVIQEALERVGLAELIPSLEEEEERWDRALSLGQQQRLAFARALLHRPAWVFLDEATAALDDENQELVMSLFDDELADTTLVSIGHRPGLELFHRRRLRLVSTPDGARLRLMTPTPRRRPAA